MNKKQTLENVEFIANVLSGHTDSQSILDESTWGVTEIGPFKIGDYSVMDEDGKAEWDYDKLETACEIYIDEVNNNYDLFVLFECFIGSHNHSTYCLLEDKKNKNGYIVLNDTEFFYRDDFVESLDKLTVGKKLVEVLLDGPFECLFTDIWLDASYFPKKDFLKILKDGEKAWPSEYPPIEEWIEKYYAS